MKGFCAAMLLLSFLLPASVLAEVFTYTIIKHATLVLQSDRTTVYVDPVGEAADFSSFQPANLILVTHINKDHLAPELVATLKEGKRKSAN
jgi:L-ascorbate metabolism protein UlaG (beta-lactamase superfamily)